MRALLVAGLMSAVFALPAGAQTLKFSDVNAKTSGAGIYNEKFAELVAEKTGGELTVENYYDGTLSGFDIQPVQAGIVDITQWGLSTDFCPFVSVLQAPYLYDDEQLLQITRYDSDIFGQINDCLTEGETGVRLISIYSWGFQHVLTTEAAVRGTADMKGLKLRVVPLQIFMETVDAMGATPTPMPWSEVMTSLATGVIDGTGMPVVYIVPAGLHKVAGHYALTRHNPTLSGVYINAAVWDAMDGEQQQALYEAGEEARLHLQDYLDENNARYLEEIEAAGVEVVPFDELDIDPLAIRDAVHEAFAEQWGDSYQQILTALGK